MPSFQPPPRPTMQPAQHPKGAGPEGLGWMQQLAEKDDLLLWVTAALGVLMPGVIYVIYHKVHAAYMKYAKKKEAARIAEEKAKEELAIFYTRGTTVKREEREEKKKEKEGVEEVSSEEEVGVAERRAKQLEEFMGEERPKMRAIEEMRVDEFALFKGFAIFIVESTESGHAKDSYEWFLDWLETVAANKKERKRLQTADMKYAILGMSESGKAMSNRAAETLSKRLRILGASPVVPDRNFDRECEGYDPEELFRVWAEDLFLAIDRYGIEEEDEYEDEEEMEDEEGGESGEEESGGEEEEERDPMRDGMRRRKV